MAGVRGDRVVRFQQHFSGWGGSPEPLEIDYTIRLMIREDERDEEVSVEGKKKKTRVPVGKRHIRQINALMASGRLNIDGSPISIQQEGPGAAPLFDDDLTWAFRPYELQIEPLPTVSRAALFAQNPDLREIVEPESARRLYLFNVIVALEWHPDAEYLRVLEVAFKRASDFLFDVTNGYCAFGQVIVGGPELMGAADIQIVASDRFHPRSWVGGLYLEHKFVPIRIGRAFWDGGRRRSIGWEEPEGYRILVHEWLHYGLALKDAYLQTREVQLCAGKYRLRIPNRAPIGASVMADSVISELRGEEIRDDARKYLPKLPEKWGSNRGPYRFPLPLPHVCALIKPDTTGAKTIRHAKSEGKAAQGVGERPALKGERGAAYEEVGAKSEGNGLPIADREIDEGAVPEEGNRQGLDQSWVYLYEKEGDSIKSFFPLGTLGPPPAATSADAVRHLDEGEHPKPALKERMSTDLALFGGKQGGKVIAISERRTRELGARIAEREQGTTDVELSPGDFLSIGDVPLLGVHETGSESRHRTRSVRVQLHPASAAAEKMKIWLLPLGYSEVPDDFQDARSVGIAWERVPTLDGHIVVHIASGENERFIVYPFSQGGGPPAHDPIGSAPATGGSADGNLLVYFPEMSTEKGHTGEPPPEVHLITTRIPGEPLPWPTVEHREVIAPGGIYALTVNRPLPELEMNGEWPEAPTLVLTFHWPEKDGEPMLNLEPVVFRVGDSNKWEPLTDYTHTPAGRNFVAMPLESRVTAPKLYQNAPTCEVYRIFWLGPKPPAPQPERATDIMSRGQ